MNKRPNILLIVTDQQRYDTIQALGASHLLTPHLDWLAETGIHFSRAYTESPVCVSSRACMLTGRHFQNLGIYGWWGTPTVAEGTPTLPGLLTAAGYQTHGYGKFHHRPVHANYGWEHIETLSFYYRELRQQRPDRIRPMDHGLGQNEMTPAISTVHENDSLTRWTIERGVRFLETHDPTRPFCLYLGISKPHPPFDPPLNYWQLYQNRSMPDPIRGDWSQDSTSPPPGFMETTWSLNGCDAWNTESLREMRRAYSALISQVDYQLGHLFTRLRELKVLEETMIIFTSDHGEMLGDHWMGGKSVFLEPSARVPCLVRPHNDFASLRGSTCDSITCMADILPTVCEIAGITPPDPCDGMSLIAQAEHRERRERLFHLLPPMCGVLDGSMKYLWAETGDEMMFNLANDPFEQTELIRTGRFENERNHLRSLIAKELSDSHWGYVQNGQLEPRRQPSTRATVRATPWPGFHSADHCHEDLLH